MSEIADKTPEQEYVDSVEDVVKRIGATGADAEVTLTLASIWAQAKASEITTLNVVRQQLEQDEQ